MAACGGHHRQDLEIGHEGDVVQREDVGRVRHRQGERAADALDRQHLVFLRDVSRNQPECLAVDVEIGQRDGRDAVLAGQEADQLLLADEAQANEDRPELVRLALLLGQGLTPQLLCRDEPLGDEEVAEATDHMLPELHLRHSNYYCQRTQSFQRIRKGSHRVILGQHEDDTLQGRLGRLEMGEDHANRGLGGRGKGQLTGAPVPRGRQRQGREAMLVGHARGPRGSRGRSSPGSVLRSGPITAHVDHVGGGQSSRRG